MAAKRWVLKHSPAMLEPLGSRKKGTALSVLRELAFAAEDDEGHGALRRQQQLARDTGLSQRQVQRVLAELERLDLIRRHKGDRLHCPQCKRARRGMVVYDVVIAPEPDELRPGQETLLFGALTDDTVSSVANRDQRRGVVSTDDVVSSLNDSTTRSTANNPSLKGSPSISSAPSGRPLFDFRTAGTDRAGGRAGAGRSPGRRSSRSSSDVGSPIQVAAPSPCVLLGYEAPDLVSLYEFWDPIAETLERAVPESSWHIWLVQVHPHLVAGDRLVVGAPEDAVMWVRSRFGRVIGRCAAAAAGRPHVDVEVASCLGAPALALPGAAA